METSNKKRSVSTTSSSEYVNEGFENTELESKTSVTIQENNDLQWVKNPFDGTVRNVEDGTKDTKRLQNFSGVSSNEESTDVLLPTGFRKMYVAALVVLVFAICMGVTASYSATATADMEKPHSSVQPTKDEISLISSLVTVGALFGGTAGGYLSNALGRKGTLMINVVPFVAGWILIAYAESTGVIYVGRIITGFCTGIVSVATPMYLIEISTLEIRGLLGASFQLFVVTGVLLIAVLAAGLNWRWMAMSGGLLSFLAAGLMLLMPESPRWLLAKKKRKEALEALTFLQGESFDAETECQVIEEEINNQPKGSIQFREFLLPTLYKPLLLSISLMFFQQFSGINAVLFYTVDIFKAAKVPLDPVVATIICAFVQVLATAVSSVLMDRAGRKPLLLISAACMAISLVIFGGYDLAKSKDPSVTETYGWLPVLCLTLFLAAFSIGFGPTPWLMVAEMTSSRFRSFVSGVATALNWFFAFVVTFTFKKLEQGIHGYGVYWLYASFCASSIIVTKFFLPETKGKQAQEIEDFFNGK